MEAAELLASGLADVNYAGVVWLNARRVAEAALREGAAAELRASREEIRADISLLFLAAGNGDVTLVRVLLVITLNMELLVAGTRYHGEFEERLKKLMEENKQ